jgi:hypothetical protein
MQWTVWNWFSVVGAACLCGWLSARITVARLAAARNLSTKSALDGLARRLTDSESLLSELVAALSRIEARDRMRQVRAAKADPPNSSSPSLPTAEPSAQLPTAELRRQLAARQLLRR